MIKKVNHSKPVLSDFNAEPRTYKRDNDRFTL